MLILKNNFFFINYKKENIILNNKIFFKKNLIIDLEYINILYFLKKKYFNLKFLFNFNFNNLNFIFFYRKFEILYLNINKNHNISNLFLIFFIKNFCKNNISFNIIGNFLNENSLVKDAFKDLNILINKNTIFKKNINFN